MARKIINHTVTIVTNNGFTNAVVITALCDDGTLWVNDDYGKAPDEKDGIAWLKLPAIPDDVPNETCG